VKRIRVRKEAVKEKQNRNAKKQREKTRTSYAVACEDG
jgi:hypothetical protein